MLIFFSCLSQVSRLGSDFILSAAILNFTDAFAISNRYSFHLFHLKVRSESFNIFNSLLEKINLSKFENFFNKL